MGKIVEMRQVMQEKLESPQLMNYIIDEIHKEGVIGEESAILALTIKVFLSLVKNHSPTSSNIVVSDKTGGGKDFVVSRVLNVLCQPSKTIHRTNLTPAAFNYWQPLDSEGNKTSWDGKVLYLEDLPEEALSCQAFKTMSSGGCAITTVQDQEAVEIEIDGKPVIILTSMKSTIDVEGERRWDCVRIDLSQGQTENIVENFLESVSGVEEETEKDEMFRDMLQSMQAYEVVIPFAPKLKKYVATSHVMRTQVRKLVDYISSSTVLHQYQREKDKRGRLIATWDDYVVGRFIFKILKNQDAYAMTRKEEQLMNYLKEVKEAVTLRTIVHNNSGITRTWLLRHKEDLVEREIVDIVMAFDDDLGRNGEHWIATERCSASKVYLPRAENLTDEKTDIIDGIIFKTINEDRISKGLKKEFRKQEK
ncbi:MAG: hypothetical protein DRO67_00945 [Candidatus Asgardarchaeum californiense]|nr:MAG: hypothetical protein DRO67_00945 [Candidatus Asgardarchaeum californiense]